MSLTVVERHLLGPSVRKLKNVWPHWIGRSSRSDFRLTQETEKVKVGKEDDTFHASSMTKCRVTKGL